jgi:hypothetical protein
MKRLVLVGRVALTALVFALSLAAIISLSFADQGRAEFFSEHQAAVTLIDASLLIYAVIAFLLMPLSTGAFLVVKNVDKASRGKAVFWVWIVPFFSVVLFLSFGLKLVADPYRLRRNKGGAVN